MREGRKERRGGGEEGKEGRKEREAEVMGEKEAHLVQGFWNY